MMALTSTIAIIIVYANMQLAIASYIYIAIHYNNYYSIMMPAGSPDAMDCQSIIIIYYNTKYGPVVTHTYTVCNEKCNVFLHILQ